MTEYALQIQTFFLLKIFCCVPQILKRIIIWPHSILESYWSRSNHMAQNKE